MTSRVIIGPDGKYVPQPELTPGVYSPCKHYLCERCGGTGQQAAGCWDGKAYAAPAGTCDLCEGSGRLGEVHEYREPARKQTVIPGRVAAVFLVLASMAAFVVGVLVGRVT